MIIHLPEGMVPFEDSGFERHPRLPLIGQPVTLGCRLEGNEEIPYLILRLDGREERLEARPGAAGGLFRFELGAFDRAGEVAYQFTTQQEASPWYRFEVLEEARYTRARSVLKTTTGYCLVLDHDLSLDLQADGTLTLKQAPAEGVRVETAEIPLSNDYKMRLGGNFLWKLNRLSGTAAEALAYVALRDGKGRIRQSGLEMRLPGRHIFGTGERFDAVDMKGGSSNGRVVEKFTRQGDMSYLPMPFFMTEAGLGWYREGGIPTRMRFADTVTLCQRAQGTILSRDHLFLGRPDELLRAYIRLTGQPALPPEWAFGVWISGNGWKDDAEVDAQLEALRAHGYPASVMVLEQWSDEQTFYRWHEEHFPNPEQTVRRIRGAGLRLLLWQIPVLKHDDEHPRAPVHEADIQEAVRRGHVIRREDGSPYRINGRWFAHSLMPDFTNPEARAWWFGKRKYLLDMGVEGFKTDGGEFLFEEGARLHNGMRGLEAHNLYTGQYVEAYQNFLKENGVRGLTFSRAGYVGAQTQPAHWAGDQLSTFSELQAQLRAGISAGLSGILFWGFDIGGFAGPIPTAELYLRATALACFCPIMQWHSEPRGGQYGGMRVENNDRSPWNLAQRLGDPRVLSLGIRFARLRESLRPYLWQEAQACVRDARPLIAHLCLDWPEDAVALSTHDQFMLGRELMVAPVVEEGQTSRRVYLPEGVWEDFFTGRRHSGNQTLLADAPLERIPVFRRLTS